MDLSKISGLAAKAVADGVDMTVAKQGGGGGDYTPPAEGPVRLRFISYVEIGKHEKTVMGKTKVQDTVLLTFELSGPKHAPRVLDDGTKIPDRITIRENLSLNEKANFYKLFTRMNYAGKAQHMAQLLGEAYKGKIVHRKFKRADGSEGVVAELKVKGDGYTIEPPRYEDVESGEYKLLPVDPAITPIKCLLWNYADMEQWNSIFIDGEYEERKDKDGKVVKPAKSKNVLQNEIKRAKNFPGSPVYTLLAANGQSLDIPDAESGMDEVPDDDSDAAAEAKAAIEKAKQPATPSGAAATDALNGIV